MIKYTGSLFLVLSWLIAGCVVNDSATNKLANGLIVTPPSYYSTAKAKYLGTKYKENLDRLVERIVRNPKTATLQFANNISSVGGIGFFTHSATKTPDERYLEVVLATPETFESRGEYSQKVHQLFSRYGHDLLNIVSGDSEVYQDPELSGYGLNLAWRTVISEPTGNRVSMAQAIIYFSKERVHSYVRDEISQDELLSEAVIFGEEENGPLALVSYQPQNPRPDFRPAIREDNLASAPAPSKPAPVALTAAPIKEPSSKPEPKVEAAQKASPVVKETAPRLADKPKLPEIKAEVESAPMAQQSPTIPQPRPDSSSDSAEKSTSPGPDAVGEEVAAEQADKTPSSENPATATKAKPAIAATQPTATPIVKDPAPKVEAKPAETKPAPMAMAPAKPTPTSKSAAALPSVKSSEVPVQAARQVAPKSGAEAKESLPETKATKELAQAPKSSVPLKPVEDREKGKTTQEATPQKTTVTAAPVAKAADKSSAVESRAQTAVPLAAKSESRPAAIASPVAPPMPRQPEAPAKASAPQVLSSPAAKAPPLALAIDEKAPEPVAPKPATAREEKPVVAAPKEVPEVKKFEPKKQQPASSLVASAPKADTAPRKNLAPAPALKENFEEKTAAVKTKPAVSPSAPVAKAPQPASPAEPTKPTPAVSAEKKEPTIVGSKPAAPTASPVNQAKASEKPTGEQVALLKNKPVEVIPEKKSLMRPPPKALEGFIIQLAFNDKERAQHWAEAMERRGFAVSITETGADGALRVRLGNFAMRDEAERQLRTFKQDGMSGIIINLPQAFRPEARSSIP
jgi:cell division protein FtsN